MNAHEAVSGSPTASATLETFFAVGDCPSARLSACRRRPNRSDGRGSLGTAAPLHSVFLIVRIDDQKGVLPLLLEFVVERLRRAVGKV